MAGSTRPAMITVSPPKRGSTAPESMPNQNDFALLFPSAYRGMDMIAPSGKFCIAMPRARARAAPAVIFPDPLIPIPFPVPKRKDFWSFGLPDQIETIDGKA